MPHGKRTQSHSPRGWKGAICGNWVIASSPLRVNVKQLWPSKGQGPARVPKSQQFSARPKSPPIAIEETHVSSSGDDGIDVVVCSLSSNLLKTVTGAELFGGSMRPVMV